MMMDGVRFREERSPLCSARGGVEMRVTSGDLPLAPKLDIRRSESLFSRPPYDLGRCDGRTGVDGDGCPWDCRIRFIEAMAFVTSGGSCIWWNRSEPKLGEESRCSPRLFCKGDLARFGAAELDAPEGLPRVPRRGEEPNSILEFCGSS